MSEHVNAAGGRQTDIPTRFDLIPPHAIDAVAQHLAGDATETHLANAVCRLLFAMEINGNVEIFPQNLFLGES